MLGLILNLPANQVCMEINLYRVDGLDRLWSLLHMDIKIPYGESFIQFHQSDYQ